MVHIFQRKDSVMFMRCQPPLGLLCIYTGQGLEYGRNFRVTLVNDYVMLRMWSHQLYKLALMWFRGTNNATADNSKEPFATSEGTIAPTVD